MEDVYKGSIRDPNPWNNDLKQGDMPVLYNIEHDPSEKYNIAEDNSDIVNKIFTLSEEHVKKYQKCPLSMIQFYLDIRMHMMHTI